MSGIRTLDDLKARCVVDDITGCWHWKGGTSRGLPSMRFPALGCTVGPGPVLRELLPSKKRLGPRLWRCCESRDCCAPDHWKGKAPSVPCTSSRRAAIAKGMRAKSMLTETAVQEIRSAEGTLMEIAAQYGCSGGHVSKIKLGRVRTAAIGGASVFTQAALRSAA